MTAEQTLERIRSLLLEWASKQGHNSCWYYPEIFRKLADELGLDIKTPNLPPLGEFDAHCQLYQSEIYTVEKEINEYVQAWCAKHGFTGTVERKKSVPTYKVTVHREGYGYDPVFSDLMAHFDLELTRKFDHHGIYVSTI